MHAIVHAADVQDRDGGALLMASLFGAFPFLIKLYADGGYQGPEFQSAIKRIWRASTSRSSSDRVKPQASSRCPNAGSSNAHSLGSAAADDWPRTGNASTTRRSPSSASPPSVSCCENYAIPHDVLGQTLTSLVIALRMSVACMTLSVGELWQIILSISAAPTVLVGWIIAVRTRQTLTRMELKHQKLVSSARIDGLTGLLNRPGFDAVAAEAFEETRRSGQPVSALVCDIDAFRVLNERYGHKAGDRALRNLTEVIEELIGRCAAILGRQGGDEFVILLPSVNLNEATSIAERLCEACEARALVHQHPAAKFTISVGVGTEALGASELGGLLRQTDAALYRAKSAGGNQVASGSTRFVQRHSAPSIERFPTRSAKLLVPVTTLVTQDRGRPLQRS